MPGHEDRLAQLQPTGSVMLEAMVAAAIDREMAIDSDVSKVMRAARAAIHLVRDFGPPAVMTDLQKQFEAVMGEEPSPRRQQTQIHSGNR